MNYKNMKVVDELLEILNRKDIVKKMLTSFYSWSQFATFGVEMPDDVWLNIHNCLSSKWGFSDEITENVNEYEEELRGLLNGTKQIIKTEILLAMLIALKNDNNNKEEVIFMEELKGIQKLTLTKLDEVNFVHQLIKHYYEWDKETYIEKSYKMERGISPYSYYFLCTKHWLEAINELPFSDVVCFESRIILYSLAYKWKLEKQTKKSSRDFHSKLIGLFAVPLNERMEFVENAYSDFLKEYQIEAQFYEWELM